MKRIIIFAGILFALVLMPKAVLAATLYINPGSGSFGVGSTFTVSVRSNTQGVAVNTAEANITYSTDTLELVSVAQGSTFYLSSPGSPVKGTGSAYFAGGLPTPGYTGTGGILGSMTFRAKAAGTATVSIGSGKVLLNDGLGTDALSSSAGARFTITPPPVAGPVVSSSSHPDQNSWYAKDDVELSWSRPADAYGFSFEFDQNPNTIPDSTLDTTVTTTKSYSDLKDGQWYFHIKARAQSPSAAFGGTTHFKIGVDTQKPQSFEIKVVDETITFESTDEISGIDHYDVLVDGKLVESKATSPYTFSKLTNGSHQIQVTAFDKAGNDRKVETTITVQGAAPVGFFQRNLSIPVYLLLIMNLLVLILLMVLIWLLIAGRRRRRSDDPIRELQDEIDETLEKLKHDIDTRLLKLTAKSSDDFLEKQAKLVSAVTEDINKTKKKIDSKIDRTSRKG